VKNISVIYIIRRYQLKHHYSQAKNAKHIDVDILLSDLYTEDSFRKKISVLQRNKGPLLSVIGLPEQEGSVLLVV
jgi:hypothetical protein